MVDIIISGKRRGSEQMKGRVLEKAVGQVSTRGVALLGGLPQRVMGVQIAKHSPIVAELIKVMGKFSRSDSSVRIVQGKYVKGLSIVQEYSHSVSFKIPPAERKEGEGSESNVSPNKESKATSRLWARPMHKKATVIDEGWKHWGFEPGFTNTNNMGFLCVEQEFKVGQFRK